MLEGNILDSDQGVSLLLVLVLESQDGEPSQDCPEAILFPNVVAACPKRLLPTNITLPYRSQTMVSTDVMAVLWE